MLRETIAMKQMTDSRTPNASWRFGASAVASVGELSVIPMVKLGHVRHTGNVWPLRPQEVSSG